MANSSDRFASTFAPYTPPPDDPSLYRSHEQQPIASSSLFKSGPRPWFPNSTLESNSYQSGAVPSFQASHSGGAGSEPEPENRWATSSHLRVDLLAAFAYLLGPISALALLIIETQNDYVRFHAYQSALLTTPLIAIRISMSLLRLPGFLLTFFTLLFVLPTWYMAFRAYIDATRNGLSYFHVPRIGVLAERWLGEE
jgi:uncharacterized membrane protein